MAKLRVLASSALRSLTITLRFTAGNTPLLLKDKLSNTDKGTMGRKVEACLGGAVEKNEQKLHHRNQGPCSPELKVLSFFSDLNTLKQPVSAAEFHPARGSQLPKVASALSPSAEEERTSYATFPA